MYRFFRTTGYPSATIHSKYMFHTFNTKSSRKKRLGAPALDSYLDHSMYIVSLYTVYR